jgi:zinc/manganese transport system substrate-binding protein
VNPVCAVLLAAVAVGATACSSSSAATQAAPDASGPVTVVASTDVYGDIVKVIGGDAVTVTSIIDDPDLDPHEYEGDAQTQLALSKARLVVENGGGYDDFVDTLLSSAPTRPAVVDVADLSGYDQGSAEFNEHLWYDFPTMVGLAERLRADLTAAAPARAATFSANAEAFTAQLQTMERREAAIKKAHAGEGVAVTEPVPLYLLDAAGLDDKTPAAFSKAVEEGTDVAPSVLRATTDLFDQHQVAMLVDNEQTGGPQTDAVRAAAGRNGIPVVPVTETLPAGQTYLTWMQGYLGTISRALGA